MIEYICIVDDHGDLVPTMEEGYELVRCKDCKYCKYNAIDNANYCLLNHNREQSDEWFCADAERMEE